jgi:hypothetical protein
MNIFELRKKSFAALLLASVALVMLPGCSTTEETSSTDTGSSSEGEDTHPLSCDENDTEQQCKDQIM